MPRNKKTNIQIATATTAETIKVVNSLCNMTEDDIYNIISSRTAVKISEMRFKHLMEGNNPEYCALPDFEGYKEILRKRFNNTPVHVDVYDGSINLISADYADIRVAFLNHSEMLLDDTIASSGRDGICYKTAEGYFVQVLGNYVAGTIDKKKK